MSDVIHITDALTRADLAEAITALGRKASREVPAVGSSEFPTPWDLRHSEINRLLTQRETAKD